MMLNEAYLDIFAISVAPTPADLCSGSYGAFGTRKPSQESQRGLLDADIMNLSSFGHIKDKRASR